MGELTDELMAQRDAVLFGTHVHHSPRAEGEACLVARAVYLPYADLWTGRWVSYEAEEIIDDVLRDRGVRVAGWIWNDSGVPTLVQVLDVLGESVRRAKEQEDSAMEEIVNG